MKKNKQNIIIYILIILLITYLINSTTIVKSINYYTNLFITKLFPTSFIIYITSSILIDYGIINIIGNPKIYIIFMSLLTGFPSGSKYIKELLDKGLIDTNLANHLITYTFFPNPIFILGTVSTILSKTLSIKILLITIISNYIISLIFKQKKKQTKLTNNLILPKKNFSMSLKEATYGSIKTLLIVYSSSLFFYLITVIINKYLYLSPILYVIINGLFDLTNGIFKTTILSNINLRALLILYFISFGSIAIHIQIKSIISDTNIKYKNFFLARIIQLLISSLLFLII